MHTKPTRHLLRLSQTVPKKHSSAMSLFPRHRHTMISPWHQRISDPWIQPYHQPFFNLFNDTFAELDRMTSDLNSRFGDITDLSSKLVAPKFDVKETDSEFLLEGELPGVEKKNINLDWADDNTLVLKTRTESVRKEEPAEQKNDVEMSGANPDVGQSQALTTTEKAGEVAKNEHKPTYHLTERSVGMFQRTFNFPGKVEHDQVKASLKNGVLTVSVPKVVKEEISKTRSVAIEEVDDAAEEKAKL